MKKSAAGRRRTPAEIRRFARSVTSPVVCRDRRAQALASFQICGGRARTSVQEPGNHAAIAGQYSARPQARMMDDDYTLPRAPAGMNKPTRRQDAGAVTRA